MHFLKAVIAATLAFAASGASAGSTLLNGTPYHISIQFKNGTSTDLRAFGTIEIDDGSAVIGADDTVKNIHCDKTTFEWDPVANKFVIWDTGVLFDQGKSTLSTSSEMGSCILGTNILTGENNRVSQNQGVCRGPTGVIQPPPKATSAPPGQE
ncbi:hypothetical protein GP486_002415 [Trichoglossum hirsutum]|uniref:AA1-like domain-containing protein n=1 Tax=Trichoglossum hirsutum TaxID=265104 RepID=A0A9P8RS52_9PEZI|nr:hypothetical protein GP486_002415 [Trichoglossum hirsutum]